MELSSGRVQEDAKAVFDIIVGGGISIVPLDVAYAIIGYKGDAIKKIFAVKKCWPSDDGVI